MRDLSGEKKEEVEIEDSGYFYVTHVSRRSFTVGGPTLEEGNHGTVRPKSHSPPLGLVRLKLNKTLIGNFGRRVQKH